MPRERHMLRWNLRGKTEQAETLHMHNGGRMIELGKIQTLSVWKVTDFGVYVGETEEERVLLPKKQVPEDTQVGDDIEVFIYRDSKDRLIATTNRPALTLGETAVLTVKEMAKIGAFLDWGLEKDLFLPYKEQTYRIKAGDRCLVALYTDKSSRLCATMKVYRYLCTNHSYQKNDEVDAFIYEVNPTYGAFAAVDGKYQALVSRQELHRQVAPGEMVKARVAGVREDGKLQLSLNKKIFEQMEEDAGRVLKILRDRGGALDYGEKAPAEWIERDFGLSKNAFKRALGRLYKEGLVILEDDSIHLK